jgi:hypothetical protein
MHVKQTAPQGWLGGWLARLLFAREEMVVELLVMRGTSIWALAGILYSGFRSEKLWVCVAVRTCNDWRGIRR